MRQGLVEVDLHGMNVWQAKNALDAALRRAGGATYRLRVVHGYHRGSRLRELVREEYGSHPAVSRVVAVEPGVTDLVLREF